MFCTRCGHQLGSGDAYCSQCATPTGRPSATGAIRLMRSRYGNKIAGVCAGVARYLDVDPTFVRLLWLTFIFVPPGIGVIAYIIAWIVMPKEPPRLEAPAVEAARAYPV